MSLHERIRRGGGLPPGPRDPGQPQRPRPLLSVVEQAAAAAAELRPAQRRSSQFDPLAELKTRIRPARAHARGLHQQPPPRADHRKDRLAVGRRIDEASPMVDARLPDGSRVNAIIPPLALSGPALTVRKFSRDPYGADDLIGLGTLS